MSFIKFINHASVLISNKNSGVLTDPWYEGSVFNNGWDLLVNVEADEIIKILDEVNYIWISHEHPDHFSPFFFTKYKNKILENSIQILFQETKDKRVVNFLRTKGFSVIEIKNNKTFKVDKNFYLKIQKIDFYDSALIINIDGKKIINLNDCPFENDKQLIDFAKLYGTADILLSQFSYAAWKGGVKNLRWRQVAAKEKLLSLENQAKALNCNTIIPFASFIYFSNIENSYLNDSINTPNIVQKKFNTKKISTVFFQPLENQNIEGIKQNDDSIKYWNQRFENISGLEFHQYSKTYSIDELKNAHVDYTKKIFKKNSKLIIIILSKLRFLEIFSDIDVYLIDLDRVVRISVLKGIKLVSKKSYNIKMHSDSLMFIFKNEFGFDTLTVNGNFEVYNNSFSKITKHFAIGSLNAMGFSLKYSILFNLKLYSLLLRKLTRVKKKLSIKNI